MRAEPIDDLYTELYDHHYKHNRNWHGLDPVTMAARHNCSTEYVRRVMAGIEREHPKPKQSNAATCQNCGAEIVYIGEHACNPPVLKGIGADGTWQNIRMPHRETCPQKWKGESGIEAATGEQSQ